MRNRRVIPIVLFAACLCHWGATNGTGRSAARGIDPQKVPQAAVTVIEITDKVLIKDTLRLGINLGGDAYYSGAALLKKRSVQNFEGTTYRQCHWGHQDEGGISTAWPVREKSGWLGVLKGADFTILSGPAKGTTGTISGITTREAEFYGKTQDRPYFIFDKKIPAGGKEVGILIEKFLLDEGWMGPRGGYWNAQQNRLLIGDTPPGSFGNAAALLDGTKEKSHMRFSTHYQRYGQTNGTWNVHFWARAKEGTPTLTVRADRNFGESRDVPLSATWKKHQLTIRVDKAPEPKDAKDNPHLLFLFNTSGGAALLDDLEIWMEGDENPTVFRDQCVETLRQFGPGVIRYLQMGGSTVANTLAVRLRAHRFQSSPWFPVGPYQHRGGAPYGLPELYELCEHLGAEPWYSLPGTMHQEEMEKFIEFLAAPPEVGYGKLRAELGHPQPWTETLRRIHVEFGNEAWNTAGPYVCGGFNGPDYWKDLIATAKSSPHYKQNILFHIAGQNFNSWLNRRILANAPNADRFGIAPYIIHDFSKEEAELLDSDDRLFRFLFAYPMCIMREGGMVENGQLSKQHGVEFSLYEVNHHITHGDAPLEPRNRMVTSIGGGLNVLSTMMMLLKQYGIRTQCLFSFIQHSYNAPHVGAVRLWGTALSMRKGQERYRPTFLACQLANKVIGGDLVETVHTGEDPAFSATGKLPSADYKLRNKIRTLDGFKVLHSYAFADGRRRGLILLNLDTSQARVVAVKFDGRPKGPVQSWLLTADRISANNEFEAGRPQVKITEQTISAFSSGQRLVIPPFSAQALVWGLE